jgi:anti-sigma factor RsiW
MRCRTVRERLVERETPLTRRERRHLARCPGCRAELARYDSLDEGRQALETMTAVPPAGLEQELMAIPARYGRRRVRGHLVRNRTTYAGGLAVAAAAAAYWRTRSRRLAAA